MVSAGLSVVRSTKPGYFPEWLLNIPFLVAVFRSQIKTDPSPDWSPLEEIYSIFFFFNEHPELFIWESGPVGSSCLHVQLASQIHLTIHQVYSK